MRIELLGLAVLVAMAVPAGAQAKPCGEHVARAKVACVKQYKRDKLEWPPRPTKGEVVRRIGPGQWEKALRVAQCETGGNWRHYPSGTYTGGLGMYRGTYAYGARVTGYRWPGQASKAEQIAVAVAAFPITRGWSGWGCGGA